jgi:hypothetical protein
MEFEKAPPKKINNLGEKLKRMGKVVLAAGAISASPAIQDAEAKSLEPSTKIESVEVFSDSIVANLNGSPSEAIKEMLRNALAQVFPEGLPKIIGDKKVQFVFNLTVDDRPASSHGTINASATLRWEVTESQSSKLVRRGSVSLPGPAAFDINSARNRAVARVLENISPEIKNLLQ